MDIFWEEKNNIDGQAPKIIEDPSFIYKILEILVYYRHTHRKYDKLKTILTYPQLIGLDPNLCK